MTDSKKNPTLTCSTCDVEQPRDNFYETTLDRNQVQCKSCKEKIRQARLKRDAETRRLQKMREAERKKIRKRRTAGRKRYTKERAEREKKVARAMELEADKAARDLRAQESKANAVQRELAARLISQRHLMPFILRTTPNYLPGWVHKDICSRLEKFSKEVAEKQSPRLMIQMPPRHGKSEIASVKFPPWHLGNYPSHEIITASYAASLANDFSRKVRQLVRSEKYKVTFDAMRLDPDAQGVEGWRTTKGGGYTPAGVGGPITGKGAHILVIDDPIKNAEEADSETLRQSIKDWYQSTAYTRLAPGGGVLIIQTRWHDDDLSGWLEELMSKDDGDVFEIVRYPAIAVEDEKYRRKGDALHLERYDVKQLERIKKAVGPRTWQALYQQTPVADDGDYFTRDMLHWYQGPPPEDLTTYAAWDLAIGKGDRNDYTVGIVIGVDKHENLWVLDMRRGRWNTFEIVEQMLDVQKRYHPREFGIEKGQIQMAIGPFLDRRIAEERMFEMAIKELPPGRRDKESRARSIQGRMRQGRVFLPRDREWVDTLVHELLRFPNGVHDDCVDALAWLGIMLQEMTAPFAGRQHRKRKSWKDKINKLQKPGRRKHFMTA